ncbi:MAG: bifunctional glutamate N-acetyltransferase/amino-acid acetyltransferase ArgJ [Actinomycetota bacterium]|nr:bifunctional glutamate N-acetyltransferase/amino-acid acetyltransferase ArgJ [Actinomycetota bacterium]
MEDELYKMIEGGVAAPLGFLAAGVACGIKASGKKDLALIVSKKKAKAAAVFTTNKMAAAPVEMSRMNIADGLASAAVINSGNANACTGEAGRRDAKMMAEVAAEALKVEAKDVIVASTGIIGVPLPTNKIFEGIREGAGELKKGGNAASAEAIMTTDTYQKEMAISLPFGGREVRIGGMAKGSGMIAPNMATMLAFITTDIDICRTCLKEALTEVVETSFNMITVDGECSTNDMVLAMANGLANNDKLISSDPDYPVFLEALRYVAQTLAKLVVKDGEGITKFIEIEVAHARSDDEAKLAAMAVANSLLVKTAFFGEDANWGRILSAVGHSGAALNKERVDVKLMDTVIVSAGKGSGFDEDKVSEDLKQDEIKLFIDLNLGEGRAVVWTCDLSYDYIKINADYRT